MSTIATIVSLPVIPANDIGKFLELVLTELRALHAEFQAQREDLLELRSQIGAPPSVAVSIEEAARRLGCARTQVFELLRRGLLRRCKSVGRRTMITVDSLDAIQVGNQEQPRRRITPPRRVQLKAQEMAAAIRDLR